MPVKEGPSEAGVSAILLLNCYLWRIVPYWFMLTPLHFSLSPLYAFQDAQRFLCTASTPTWLKWRWIVGSARMTDFNVVGLPDKRP